MMTLTKTKIHAPELRFPEFKGEWVKKKIGDVAIKVGSGSTPRGGEDVYQKTGIPFIRSQNVIHNQLILDSTHISEEIHKKMDGSKVLPNDILLNITGGSIGRSCVVPDDFQEGNVNQHVSIIRLKNDNPIFLQLVISSFKGQKLIFQGQTGSGREGLNFQSIRSFKIFFPSIYEQQKIATFLTAVDKRIDLLTQKKEKLEQYKKGVMQKLFSRELRFPDYYKEKWVEKKINEIAPLQRGFDLPNSKIERGEYPVVFSNGILNCHAEYKVKGVGVVTGRSGTIGKVTFIEKDYWPHNTSLWVTNFFNNDPKFIYYFYINLKLERYNAGSTVPTLNRNDIHVLEKKLPSLPEQQKIASFLSAIDKQIEQVEHQIKYSNQWKRGLLQKMFV